MSNGSYNETQPYSPNSAQRFDINAAPRTSRGFPWGCLLGGCLGIMLLGALGVVGAGFGAWKFVQSQITKYTSDHAVELPSGQITDDDIQAIQVKVENFKNEFESGNEPQELVITIDELNALIASNKELKGHVYAKIVDGNLRADVSFPMDEFPGGKGRFFNGSITLHVELDNGVLEARIVDAETNGNAVPKSFLDSLGKENLAKGMYDNPKTAKALARCESLEIQPDRIVLRVRPKNADQAEDSNATNPEPEN